MPSHEDSPSSGKSLLARWRERNKEVPNKPAGIPPRPEGAVVPLSLGQQRLWLLQQLHPGNPFYHYTEVYRLLGPLDHEALFRALPLLTDRHAILRTTFSEEGGQPVQVIREASPLEVTDQDLRSKTASEVQQMIYQEARRPFDLTTGPLMRLQVLRTGEAEHLLVVTMHHIITDKWSMRIWREELAALYQAALNKRSADLSPLPIQYADYAHWQRQRPADATDLRYWLQQLAGELPILDLPSDRPRPPLPTFAGAFAERAYPDTLSRQLIELSQRANTTPFVLLLSVFNILLHRYSRQTDILIGTPFTNRDQTELEKLIGFFNDTLTLRADLSGNPSFLELVDQVRQTVLDAFSHKQTPFETLVKELKPERETGVNPIFQVMFLYHQVPEHPDFGPGLELEYTPFDLGVAKFDLTLYISEEHDRLSAIFEYATDLFDAPTIERMHDHLHTLLEAVVAQPNRPISELSMLPPQERRRLLLDWNPPPPEPAFHETIVTRILGQADQHPAEWAAIAGATRISYEDLQARTEALAAHLLTLHLGANPIVGLYTERSVDMVVGMLGILRAGGAYLPLDPEYPAERIEYMLEDARATAIVTQAALRAQLGHRDLPTIIVDQLPPNSERRDFPAISDEHLAYLIYTSGSTGRPKGIGVTHRNLRYSTADRFEVYATHPGQFLLLSSFSFDSSVAGIFWTLTSGGTLILPPRRIEQDLDRLTGLIAEHRVSHTLLLPSLYQLLLQHGDSQRLDSLQAVIVAGEACAPSLVRTHFDQLAATRLYNEYGPTEATVWCTVYEVRPEDAHRSVPIGRPIPHAEIYLLDEHARPVPIGVSGELYIGGAGVTPGYHRSPEGTAERFVTVSLEEGGTKRLYRTGDLARYRPDGLIEFLGRADHQVKIRGYRIEPDEISETIRRQPSVRDALVQVQETESSGKRLVAYVIPVADLDRSDLQQQLKRLLPDYMVPSAYVRMDAWPRLPNGKIDLKALPAPDTTSLSATSDYAPPRNETERLLADCWAEVLHLPRVGIHANFFEIGGDSILSIQIISKARQAGIVLGPNQLFEHQTIAELALFVSATEAQVPEEGPVTGPFPLTPIQHWFFEEHRAAPHHWNQSLMYQLPTAIEEDLIRKGAQALVQHHDLLRAVFEPRDGEWQARILEPDAVEPFQLIKLPKDTEPDTDIEQQTAAIQAQFDLKTGPLFRVLYFDGGNHHLSRLLLVAHHLIVDMVSWQIIERDLLTLLHPERGQLPPKTTAYPVWSTWLQTAVRNGFFDSEQSFWQAQVQSADVLPLDIPGQLPVPESSIETIEWSLEAPITEQLLRQAPPAYRMRVDELLITAFLEACADRYQLSAQTILLERLGREAPDDQLDLSNTVGWFTSFFPVRLAINPGSDLPTRLKTVKEQLRQIPNGGIGYGALRYLNKAPNLGYSSATVINYLGTREVATDTLLGASDMLFSRTRDPRSERYYPLEINALIADGQLQLRWSFSRELHRADTIQQLIEGYEQALRRIVEHCLSVEAGTYTPSDFPDADLNQSDLDTLLGQIDL